MSVVVVAAEECAVEAYVRWGWRLAQARELPLCVAVPRATGGGDDRIGEVDIESRNGADTPVDAACAVVRELLAQVDAETGDDGAATATEAATPEDKNGPPSASLCEIVYGDLAAGVLKLLHEKSCELLVLPWCGKERIETPYGELQQALFHRAPCETLLLRAGVAEAASVDDGDSESSGDGEVTGGDGDGRCEILVPSIPSSHCRASLQLGIALAEREAGRVTALFVEPEVGADAQLVGLRILQRVVRGAVGSDSDRVRLKVAVANKARTGIAEMQAKGYDLLLLGAPSDRFIRRGLVGSTAERLLEQNDPPAVGVVRASLPIAGRAQQFIERSLTSLVPQLEREDRIALVERVQSNSRWDFDFVSLMCLSTLIASFGLVQNSAAVVIGAMLVAPLMTPLLGTGLALVQGNLRLIRNAVRSVALGFLLAFCIAYVVGALVPDLLVPTEEMLARGSPRMLDLGVAFFSGVAAAYATSRPGLSGALPGVAIAAALVPPVSTIGLAVSLGAREVAGGAALLFLTNIVAIVIGASFSLWAVGLRVAHQHGRARRWTLRVALLLVVAAGLLVASLWRAGVPPSLVDEIEQLAVSACAAESVDVQRVGARPIELRVNVVAPQPPPPAMADRFAGAAAAHFGELVRVRVSVEIATTAARSPPSP